LENIDVFTIETDGHIDLTINETIQKLVKTVGVLDCQFDQNAGKGYLKVDSQKFTLNSIDENLALTPA
jgi:hypothetical protein